MSQRPADAIAAPVGTFDAGDLTVVIPTRGRPEILRRTLEALASQTVSGFEVVVVVDGTDQPVPDDPSVKILVQDQSGPGLARNRGARATDRSLVLFLGDDMVPAPDLVERHLRRHQRAPDQHVAVLGHMEWHPEAGGGRILRWLERTQTQFDPGAGPDGEAGFGRFVSSNVSLKRDFFLDAGGFDAAFRYYYEDLDCAYRLHERGMVLLYEPAARAHHLHHHDLASVVRRFEGIAAGEWLLAQRRPEFPPFFLDRVRRTMDRPKASPIWPVVVEAVPHRLRRLRRRAEGEANAWYYQYAGPRFLHTWHAQSDLADLRAYLGDRYDESLLHGHAAAVDDEAEASPDEATFYRTSEMYLYDLTAFAMAGTKVPYLRDLQRIVPPGSRLLDWGCGIGADGLRLIDAGYDVTFADFENPSTAFLRWRLRRRGIDAAVHDLDTEEVPAGFDLAYAFDVIEHVTDPFALLGELERRSRYVMVNVLDPDPAETHLHRPLPVDDILRYVTDRGLVRYRRYHGRSHLVVYRSGASGMQRARGRVERRVGPRAAALRRRLLPV